MRWISAARLPLSLAAARSSTAQNSGSKASEVAWPARFTDRFFKLAKASILAPGAVQLAAQLFGASGLEGLFGLGAAEPRPVFSGARLVVGLGLGLAGLVQIDDVGHGGGCLGASRSWKVIHRTGRRRNPRTSSLRRRPWPGRGRGRAGRWPAPASRHTPCARSEEHTSELQSH